MKERQPRKIPRSAKIIGAATLGFGLAAGTIGLELPSKSSHPAVHEQSGDLADQLRHPLSPKYTTSSPYVEVVPAGQQAPVAESVSTVPGHRDEVLVQFGTDEAGYTPPSEIVHGTIPNINPIDQSPLFFEGINPADIRSTPGASKMPPPPSP